MVWAPFVQPESQDYLIPSRVPMAKWAAASGMPMYATVNKKNGWLTQVIQYNVYQMTNAIAREKQLKRWRRAKKVALVNAANPRWRDLATVGT